MKKTTVIDDANGRKTILDVVGNESLDGVINRRYEALGEVRHTGAHLVDRNGNNLDDNPGQSVSTLETDKDSTTTIEISVHTSSGTMPRRYRAMFVSCSRGGTSPHEFRYHASPLPRLPYLSTSTAWPYPHKARSRPAAPAGVAEAWEGRRVDLN